MFNELLYWDTLQKIILNTLLVSIPEEFYIIMFTLILMGEFDIWKNNECRKLFDRWDYIRVFTPVVITAVLSNVLRYIGVDIGLISIISMITALVLIIATGDIWNDASALKWVGKAFAFLMLAVFTVMVMEYLYIPFILYGTGLTIAQINNNIWLNFCVSLPERITEYIILSYFFIKKRTILKAMIFKLIFESKILMTFSFIILATNVAFMLIILQTVGYDKLLTVLSSDFRFIVILGICIFPLINISSFLWCVYYVKNNEVYKQKNAAEKLRFLSGNIKLFTNNENYDKLGWKLNGIGKDIEEVANSLIPIENKERKVNQ